MSPSHKGEPGHRHQTFPSGHREWPSLREAQCFCHCNACAQLTGWKMLLTLKCQRKGEGSRQKVLGLCLVLSSKRKANRTPAQQHSHLQVINHVLMWPLISRLPSASQALPIAILYPDELPGPVRHPRLSGLTPFLCRGTSLSHLIHQVPNFSVLGSQDFHSL